MSYEFEVMNIDIMYKSATPMKLNIVLMPGP